MSGLKLIAIRPLIGCDSRFSKNLQKGRIYKFYQEYNFHDKEGKLIENNDFKSAENINVEVYSITNNGTIPCNLYKDKIEGIEINVSAIVGKNGSGKSSLLELLYACCYSIASKKGIIKSHGDLAELINSPGINHNALFNKINQIQDFFEGLQVEIFYEIDNEYYSVRSENQNLHHRILTQKNKIGSFENGFFNDDTLERKFSYVFDKLFYYTIAINYSLYGLNSENESNWLNDLFHKNDGYQTPLVINPFRNKGNIDVNNEYHLAQTRLFTNLVNDNYSLKSPVNNKEINLILFTLDFNKFNSLGNLSIDNIIEQFKKEYELSDTNFIINVYNSLYRDKNYRLKEIDEKRIKNFDIISKYIYRKVFKIALNYEEYHEHFEIPINEKPIPKIRDFFKQLLKLQDDKSHITLKLRQVLNSIRFNILGEDEIYKWVEENDDYEKIPNKIKKHYFKININDFVNRIKTIKKQHPNFEIIELIPAACYIPKFGIQNSSSKKSISNFEDLSSGEQQFIHSIQSILYHISNINSVFYSSSPKIKYNYINLILDEIELYYHPEFQRIFVSQLLQSIRNLKIEHIKGINILFSTHSPFILSDIPSQNILKLEDGKSLDSETSENTFCANIHDLLANDFFLKNGFMGEFAKSEINQVINFLNIEKQKYRVKELQILIKSTDNKEDKRLFTKELRNKQIKITNSENLDPKVDKEYSKKIIELVGEPMLSSSLMELFSEAYPSEKETYITSQIERLSNLIKRT